MMPRKKTWQDYLRLLPETPKDKATPKRKYEEWRRQQGMPMRCDNADCRFFANPLIWNEKRLPVILDHINGQNRDYSPHNLRYLCPNCSHQLDTHGGGNKGKVENYGPNEYCVVTEGKRHHTVVASGGAVAGGSALVE